jgi:predicted nucleic acid-binding Zn ribbon protein
MGPALRRLKLDRAIKEQQAVLVWAEVVGPANARHSWAQRLARGVLHVQAGSPAWAQELEMLKPQILERLNRRLQTPPGDPLVTDIRFQTGAAAPPVAGEGPRRTPPATRADAVSLARHELIKIEQTVAEITDPDLRGQLERSFVALAKVAAWRARRGWRACPDCGRLYRGHARYCALCPRPRKD